MVCDLRHFLDLPPDTPGPARRLAEQLSSIVRTATAGDAGSLWETALPCRRRPANRPCPGRMTVLRAEPPDPDPVAVQRLRRRGRDQHWENSPFDLRRRYLALAEALHEIIIPAEAAAALRELPLLDPACERAVFRIRAHNGSAILAATEENFEELIGS